MSARVVAKWSSADDSGRIGLALSRAQSFVTWSAGASIVLAWWDALHGNTDAVVRMRSGVMLYSYGSAGGKNQLTRTSSLQGPCLSWVHKLKFRLDRRARGSQSRSQEIGDNQMETEVVQAIVDEKERAATHDAARAKRQ